MKTTTQANQVKKSIGHDRLRCVVKFPNGNELRFNIGRYGASVSAKTNADEDAKSVTTWLQRVMSEYQLRENENNGQMLERFAKDFEEKKWMS